MTSAVTRLFALAFFCNSIISDHAVKGSESSNLPIKTVNEPPTSIFKIERRNLTPIEDVNQIASDLLSTILASAVPTAFAENITEKCSQDSQDYVEALLKRNKWALKMYESNGQYPEGLIGGVNYHAVGLFDECITAYDSEGIHSFSGQYCTVFFKTENIEENDLDTDPFIQNKANEWVTILQIFQQYNNDTAKLKKPKVANYSAGDKFLPSTGLCLPSSCTPDDIRKSVAQLVGWYTIAPNTSIVTIGDENYCYTSEKVSSVPDFTAADLSMITLMSLLGFLMLTATIYDAWRKYYCLKPIDVKTEGKLVASFYCFSVIRNMQALLNTRSTVGPDSIDCLNGIRVFATTWIILGHAWRYPLKYTNFVYNQDMIKEDIYTNWFLQTVTNNSVAVDTFFLMSAMLVTGSLLREFDRKKGSFNALLFYVHRYLRLTVVYAIILGFIATIYAYLGNGPNWHSAHEISEACQAYWWQNMLYINNFYYSPAKSMCMGESWYLAVDMQLFVITPLLIYPLWRWPKVGAILIGALFVASLSATIAVFTIWDIPPTLQSTMPPTLYDTNYYGVPWFRCPPYLIGIFFGWFLHNTKRTLVVLKKTVVVGGWVAASLIALLIVYGLVPYMDERVPVPDIARVFYASFHRPAWSIATAWVIFACTKGYGGFVNKFLSCGAFTVLGRMTYVVYLVHLNLITLFYSQLRKPVYYTVFSQVMLYLAFVFLSFLVALVVCLTVELPLLSLERLHIVAMRATNINSTDVNRADTSGKT